MMRFYFLMFFVFLMPFDGVLQAQTTLFSTNPDDAIQALNSSNGIARNSISNLHAEGNSLWVGPFLNLTTDDGENWFIADADSLINGDGRVFSIDVEGDVIWVGLGKSTTGDDGNSVPTAAGFLFSEDGGLTWTYRFPPLDGSDNDTETYGGSTLAALPVIVPQQSPPYDIDYDPISGSVWTAGWASGIRRSDDNGATWKRIILPPDTLDFIHPDSSYNFTYEPQRRPDQRANNFLGFSVLVDENGTVWTGSPAGVNRSVNANSSYADSAWTRIGYNGTPNGLIGNWIISIEEQVLAGPNAIWFACWRALDNNEKFGITVTRDGGLTFEQVLQDERIYDFAFDGNTVYAAGDNGLFISENGGRTWNTIRNFSDADQPDRVLRPDVQVFSVAVTENETLWVGTTDGLLRSFDGGLSWKLFRTEVPTHPENPTAAIPDVDTYAYPNPFSPAADAFVRIRYDLTKDAQVTVRVFDFGMNLVRDVISGSRSAGAREETWDGTSNNGIRVANAVYFYQVQVDDEVFWGKILLVE